MQKSEKIIEAARELLSSFGYYVANLWHIDDVHFICEQNQLPKLTDEEARDVFKIANEQFDGETGLSWPQLEKAVYTHLRRRLIESDLCGSVPLPSRRKSSETI